MEILHIIYIGSNGGFVRTVVDRAGYERNYKPKGRQHQIHQKQKKILDSQEKAYLKIMYKIMGSNINHQRKKIL